MSASGSLLAYVHSESVELLSLPHLERDSHAFFSAVHDRPAVAVMSFSPAATHIAIIWDGQWDDANAEAPPFCLDVFDTVTHARCFSMPLSHHSLVFLVPCQQSSAHLGGLFRRARCWIRVP